MPRVPSGAWAFGAIALVAASCGREAAPPVPENTAGSLGDAGGEARGGAGNVTGGADGETGGAGLATAGDGAGGTRPGQGGATSAGGTSGSAPRGGTGALEAGMAGVLEGGGAGTGTGGTGGTGGTAVTLDPGPCGFAVQASISETISTVGIVTFSIEAGEVLSAHIDFGLDASYGLSAPVDPAEPEYRTLLLGMKPERDYHVRIVASTADDECTSEDFSLTTGSLPSGLPTVTVTTANAAALAGGYLVSSFLSKSRAFILDADGDYVWWGGNVGIGRAEQSFDGKWMWYQNINVRGGAPVTGRLAMDGSLDERHAEFGDAHHDLTVLPDETVAFIQHQGTCDAIMERAPDGTVREVVNVHEAHGGTTGCHTNSIHYHVSDDTYTFSDLNQNAYVKVRRNGEVVWILGGDTSTFTGDGVDWSRQHGHHLLAPDRLLFFSNGPVNGDSAAVELSLDLDAMTATRVWAYDALPVQSQIYGDVVRLENGNTLVAYSTAGQVVELTPDGEIAQRLEWSPGGSIGYVQKRASLYGPPPTQ